MNYPGELLAQRTTSWYLHGSAVRRSTGRMPVSYVGVLPRPSALDEVLAVEGASQAEFERVLAGAVGRVIGCQSDMGIDAVNDWRR